jgi:uncharacterized pyridoxal phosphate-containing UPF0001 family protein
MFSKSSTKKNIFAKYNVVCTSSGENQFGDAESKNSDLGKKCMTLEQNINIHFFLLRT